MLQFIDVICGFCNSDTVRLSIVGCNNYMSPSGKVLTTNWLYYNTIPNSRGCDSLYVISLTIDTIKTNILKLGLSLTVSELNGTYRWLDCNNNYAPRSGAILET